MDFDHWLFWWHHNRDEILAEVARSRRPVASPKLERLLREVAVPALRRAVGNVEAHPDIRAGALVALARAGEDRDLLLRLATAKEEDKIVREGAILGLGLLDGGGEEVRTTLIGIAEDASTPYRARCFALVALGLRGDGSPEIRDCLKRALDRNDPWPDIRISALFAMGLTGDRRHAEDLSAWLRGEGKPSPLFRAHAVAALGAIGDPRSIGVVFDALEHASPAIRRAAASAAGRRLRNMGGPGQRARLDRLLARLAVERDLLTHNLILIALGRIADGDPGHRRLCLAALRNAFERGDRTLVRPYAALGIGLGTRSIEPSGGPDSGLRAELARMLRGELAGLRGDEVALAAQAVALGLMGDRDPATGKLFLRILADRGQDRKLRSASALALGLTGEPAGREAVYDALLDRKDRYLRIDTALAAGLYGGPDVTPLLVRTLRDRKASQFGLGAAARAFSWAPDPAAVRPLLTVLEAGNPNGKYPDLTRAMVTCALGLLLDRKRGDRLARLSTGYPWRSSVPALDELLTIL